MRANVPLLTLFFLTTIWAKAENTTTCLNHDSEILGRSIRYCVERSHPEIESKNEPVIYFMHGLGGNENTWSKGGYSEALSELTQSSSTFPAITFISFETEMDSFFSDFQGNDQGKKAYETWFIQEFLPFIEVRHSVCSERTCRGLAGVSMGGFGALKTALKYPHMFGLAAANSPALPPFSIHADNEDWKEYFADTKIGVVKGMVLLKDVRKIFPSEELYQENNPITLATGFLNSNLRPDFYFDVGTEDNFGFQIGFEIFKNALDQNQFSYESFLEEGGDHFIFHHRNKNLLEFIGNNMRSHQ